MKKMRLKWLDLFLILSLLLTGSFWVYNFCTVGQGFLECVMEGLGGEDFFLHLAGSSYGETLYAQQGEDFCFPPLAYCMYYFLWRNNGVIADASDWRYFLNSGFALLLYLVYNVLQMMLLQWGIAKLYNRHDFKTAFLFPVLVLMSYPFFCSSIQNGNSVALVAVLLVIVVVLRESDSKLAQEIALILIACAAGLKFYPAVCGVIYVKEKDWKKVIRLIVYGLIAVFAPFIFFGGLDGARELLTTLLNMTEREAPFNTIKGLFIHYIGIMLGMGNQPELLDAAGNIFQQIFLVISIICVFLSRKKWRTWLFLGGIMTLYISSSYAYNSVYLLPAAVMFFYEESGSITGRGMTADTFINAVSTVLFACIYSVPLVLGLPSGGWNTAVIVYKAIYLLLFLNIIYVIMERVSDARRNRKQKSVMLIEE